MVILMDIAIQNLVEQGVQVTGVEDHMVVPIGLLEMDWVHQDQEVLELMQVQAIMVQMVYLV